VSLSKSGTRFSTPTLSAYFSYSVVRHFLTDALLNSKRYYLLEAAISTNYNYSMLRYIEDIKKITVLKYV